MWRRTIRKRRREKMRKRTRKRRAMMRKRRSKEWREKNITNVFNILFPLEIKDEIGGLYSTHGR